MLHVLVRFGNAIAAVLAACVAAAGIWTALASGNALWALAGFVAAAVGYGLLLSYVELVKLVMDMLLPK